MKKLYFICTSEHFFTSRFCPWDGSAIPHAEAVQAAIDQIRKDREELSLAALRTRGVPEAALKYIAIIEFGSDVFAFDSLLAPSPSERQR
jgi:hypothetical protein